MSALAPDAEPAFAPASDEAVGGREGCRDAGAQPVPGGGPQQAGDAITSPARLAALAATGLLDGPAGDAGSDVLDRLARMAARHARVSLALVTLVGDRRQRLAGMAGLTGEPAERRELPLRFALCRRVAASGVPVVVPDLAADARFRAAPAVTELGMRTYAGVPLTLGDGHTLGALCVFDPAPRAWTADEVDGLRDLAAAAVAELERRAGLAALRASERRYRALLRHYPAGAVFLVDHDLRLLIADGEALGPAGHASAALEGRHLRDVLPAGQADAVEPLYRVALAGEERTARVEQRGRVFACRAVPVRDEDGRVAAGMVIAHDVTEATRQGEALAASEARVRAAFDAMPGSMAVIDPDTARFLTYNDAAYECLGYTREEFGSLTLADIDASGDPAELLAVARALHAGHERQQFRRRHRTRSGEVRDVLVTSRRFDDGARALDYVTWLDVTDQVRAEAERAALEERLRQAQKMEAVGQLAGGVAHDFNNLLTIINASAAFAREALPPGSPAGAEIAEIESAAARAATLVRQLLTFSRRQPNRARPVRIGELVTGAERMLRRVIGDEITLDVDVAGAGDAVVRADPGQLEQVLMNLAVNARDAMLTPLHGHRGTGGTLGVRADLVDLPANAGSASADIVPGRWVRLQVRDTGHGMDAATQAHVFEPFFTTKAVGAGTGLGLATVFGIVRQAGGAVRVDSAPGRGATFTVLLPMAAAEGGAGDHVAGGVGPSPHGEGTVLLVEDESAVRTATRRTLERHGYAVLEACHGADALRLWREHQEVIDAVVSDLRMPEMGGRELVAVLQGDRPGLPVVLTSGYADHGGPMGHGSREAFVEKPYTADALLAALAGVLARAAPRTGPAPA